MRWVVNSFLENRYFVAQLRRVKKANGQILLCSELHEKSPNVVKNFGIWLRYNSNSGTHNMYKEFRDTSLNGAVQQLYTDMAARHRARFFSIQIIKTAVLKPSDCKRVGITQFLASHSGGPKARRFASIGFPNQDSSSTSCEEDLNVAPLMPLSGSQSNSIKFPVPHRVRRLANGKLAARLPSTWN